MPKSEKKQYIVKPQFHVYLAERYFPPETVLALTDDEWFLVKHQVEEITTDGSVPSNKK